MFRTTLCFVAARGGRVIGMVSVFPPLAGLPKAQINNLWVDVEHRRHGIATRLVNAAEGFVCQYYDDAEVVFNVDDSNAGGITFWTALGFAKEAAACVTMPSPKDFRCPTSTPTSCSSTTATPSRAICLSPTSSPSIWTSSTCWPKWLSRCRFSDHQFEMCSARRRCPCRASNETVSSKQSPGGCRPNRPTLKSGRPSMLLI